MPDKQHLDTLITEFEATYSTLLDTADSYPDDLKTQAGAVGHWSARDVLAHLCGWIVEARRRFPKFARGTGNFIYDVDNFNHVSLWLRENKTYEDIAAELRELVAELATMGREVTAQQLQRDDRYIDWFEGLIRDAKEHIIELQAFLKAQA